MYIHIYTYIHIYIYIYICTHTYVHIHTLNIPTYVSRNVMCRAIHMQVRVAKSLAIPKCVHAEIRPLLTCASLKKTRDFKTQIKGLLCKNRGISMQNQGISMKKRGISMQKRGISMQKRGNSMQKRVISMQKSRNLNTKSRYSKTKTSHGLSTTIFKLNLQAPRIHSPNNVTHYMCTCANARRIP